jgi:DDE family transposase
LKIHIAVDVKTKKIFSIKVTDEHTHDSKALPGLIDGVIKPDSMTPTAATIGKLFADCAFDNNGVFRCLANNGIVPCIKVRRNARVKKTNHILRNLSVIFQKNNLQEWKDSVSYGKRGWIAETVFSCIKRTFGEYVYSVILKNMIQEMMLKASLYNKMISI